MPAVNKIQISDRSVLTPVPSIYQASQWAYSPAGVPMSVLTGKLAADRVIKKRVTNFSCGRGISSASHQRFSGLNPVASNAWVIFIIHRPLLNNQKGSDKLLYHPPGIFTITGHTINNTLFWVQHLID